MDQRLGKALKINRKQIAETLFETTSKTEHNNQRRAQSNLRSSCIQSILNVSTETTETQSK